ncbi:hypothetical protein D3C72_1375220 [compost metagenome]
MEDAVVRAQAEVEVGFRTAVVNVRRHGVPHRAGLQDGDAQQQLAGLHLGGNDVLIDGPFVGGLKRAHFERHGVGDRDLGQVVTGVGQGGDEVEFGGIGCILRSEGDLDRTHGHIGPVAEV